MPIRGEVIRLLKLGVSCNTFVFTFLEGNLKGRKRPQGNKENVCFSLVPVEMILVILMHQNPEGECIRQSFPEENRINRIDLALSLSIYLEAERDWFAIRN